MVTYLNHQNSFRTVSRVILQEFHFKSTFVSVSSLNTVTQILQWFSNVEPLSKTDIKQGQFVFILNNQKD